MCLKLIDLGISKQRTAQTMGMTQAVKDIAGTWSYCSPEKILESKDGNVEVDLWGLGACLTELFRKAAIWEVPDTDKNGKEVQEFEFLSSRMRSQETPDGLKALLKKRLCKTYKETITDALKYDPKGRPSARAMSQIFKAQ